MRKANSIIVIKILKYLFAVIIVSGLSVAGCMSDSEKLLNKGLELFNQGHKEKAIELFGRGILSSAAIKDFKAEKLDFSGRIVYENMGGSIKIIHPTDISINANVENAKISLEPEKGMISISNSESIILLNQKGSLIKEIKSDKKNKIKSVLFIKDGIIYFIDKKLFIYDIKSGKNRQFSKNEKFEVPYKLRNYNVTLTSSDNYVVVIVGIAGTYYANFIDKNSEKPLMTNLTVSTPAMSIEKNNIYIVTGSTGSWKLERITLPGKKRENLKIFKDLLDIHLFTGGFIFEDRSGKWISDFKNRDLVPVPFNFDFIRAYGDEIVIRYGNVYYVANTDLLNLKINQLKERVPELFKAKK